MPLITVNALPLNESQKPVSDIIVDISRDFAAATNIDIKHVSITWNTIQSGCYSWGGNIEYEQPADLHPLIIDMLIPDFYKPERVAQLLTILAKITSKHTGVLRNHIFINVRKAMSGCVFDEGQVLRW